MNQKQTTTRTGAEGREAPAMLPLVDIYEDEAGITVLADLPGVARDKLDLKVEGDTLTIAGEVAVDTPQAMDASYAEVNVPRYRRVFTMSRDLAADRIEASLRDGVLKLRIPKQTHAQPRRIEVSVA
ncbi:MAG: Hsp20/alpha crystallin family protein [Burkholderiales bacterium]|nr:MAG: Hsp20/alpha crystallin family protein [Burkholderiales bacterium]